MSTKKAKAKTVASKPVPVNQAGDRYRSLLDSADHDAWTFSALILHQ